MKFSTLQRLGGIAIIFGSVTFYCVGNLLDNAFAGA